HEQCDPDPATACNKLLYFVPFNVNVNHWSGGFSIQSRDSFLNMLTNGPMTVYSVNGTDTLPPNVRAQAWIFPTNGTYDLQQPIDAGLFLGNAAQPVAPGTNCVVCAINRTNGL